MPGNEASHRAKESEPLHRPGPACSATTTDTENHAVKSNSSNANRYPARALLWLTVLFIAGIVGERSCQGLHSSLPLYFIPGALLLIPAAYAISRISGRRPYFAAPAILFLACGYLAARSATPDLPFPAALEPFFDRQMTPYIAEVTGPPEQFPDKIRIPLHLVSAIADEREIPIQAGAILTIHGNSPDRTPVFYLPGDRLIVRMSLKPFRNFKNPGAFDYARYQAEKGLYASAHLKDETFIVHLANAPGFSPGALFNRGWRKVELFRQKALLCLRRSLAPDSAGFYAALLLGYQYFLDKSWQDRIQRTGLNHLLTVSGFHLGLIAMLVFVLVRFTVRVACPRLLNRISASQIAIWPALACAVLYAFLAGFGVPPIWRSVLMLAVCFCAGLRYRFPDPLTVLALAALAILVLNPNSLWQISFQLTFACVLSIILIYPRLRRFKLAGKLPGFGHGTIAGWLLSNFEDAFWLSVAVAVLVLPLTVFHFNGLSLSAFVANIVLVPWVGWLILPSGLFALLVFSFSDALAQPLLKLCEYLLSPCLAFIRCFDTQAWSYLWTGSMPLLWLLSLYCLLIIAMLPLAKRRRCAGAAFLLLLCGYAAWTAPGAKGTAGTLTVDIIDVGQGSATLVRFPSGETMLVDGGGFRDDAFDMGKLVLAPFLWNSGVRKLDHVVLSHCHPDHANGLRFILSHFDTGSFWTTGVGNSMEEDQRGLRDLEKIASARGVAIRSFPELSESITLGKTGVWVRHPSPEYSRQEPLPPLNDLSLVLEIVFGGTALILPGDIGAKVEKAIAAGFEKGRRVLLVGAHHGSGYSNSEEFLDAVNPGAIIFSCGLDNSFGFPASAVLERCGKRNIPVYRTDLHGAIHAVSDGHGWTVTTSEKQRGRGSLPSPSCTRWEASSP